MAYTWQYLGHLASEFRRLSQLTADLETDLVSKGIDVPQPDIDPLGNGGRMCYPPYNCKLPLHEFRRELSRVREYQDTVLKKMDDLLAFAQAELGKEAEFSHRLVEKVIFPGPPVDPPR